MKINFLIFYFLFLSYFANGQIIINGKITSKSNNEPLYLVNIVAYNVNGDVINGTTSTDNGYYEINNIPKNKDIKLCFFLLGYNDTCVKVSTQNNNLTFDISLQPKIINLNEVVVSEKINPTEIKDQKIILNIANTPLKEATDLTDVLKYIPGATVKNSTIEFFGKGTPLILLNGKQVSQEIIFNTVKPEDIKSIEISNSSAKYDASVQKIINIVTTSKKETYGGKLYTKLILNDGTLSNNSFLNLYLSHKKSTHYLKYSNNFNKSPWYESSKIQIFKTNDSILNNNFFLNSIDYNNGHDIFYSFEKKFNNHHALSLQSSAGLSDDSSKTDINTYNNNDYYSNSMNEKSKDKNLNVVLNYEINYDSLFKLNITLDDYYFKKNTTEMIYEKLNDQKFNNNKMSTYNISSARIDFAYFIKKLQSNLNIGVQYILSVAENENKFNSIYSLANELFNNKNNLQETYQAYYAELGNLTINNFSLQLGLRTELYRRETKLITDSTTKQKNTDNYIYPFASLTWSINDNTQLMIGYSTNINRQAYDLMANNNLYINPYLYRTGNPFLKPTLIRSINGTFNTNNFFIEGSYNYYQNYSTMFFRNVDSIMIAYFDNCTKKDIQSSINYYINADNFYFSVGSGLIKPYFKYEFKNKIYESNQIMWKFDINLNWSITKNFILVTYFDFKSKEKQDLFLNEPVISYTLGFQRFFFDKKFRISLFGYYNSIEKYTMEYKNISMLHDYKRNYLYFSISLLYKFNKDINVQSKSILENEKARIN